MQAVTTVYQVRLTPGYIARHAPAQSAQGREAALIDIAQDLLLRDLADQGVLGLVTFKGGTALRKVYAGAGGRFSTDLDFAVADPNDDFTAVSNLIENAINGRQLGPFTYGIEYRRGRPHITYISDLGLSSSGALQSKLDIAPPPWLTPTTRSWVPLSIHERYGGPLPQLPIVQLEENIAEKIARLNRRTLARDAFDLAWIAQQPGITLNQALIRRLAVLKCWVDKNGLTSAHHTWAPIPDAQPFDVTRWLQPRAKKDFDDEQIGLLTTPPPNLDDLGASLSKYYGWLTQLDQEEKTAARAEPGDRGLILRLLTELPGGRIDNTFW